MGKGRKPLASIEKERNGSFAKNPSRRNPNEPQPKFGRPEKTFSVQACEKLSGHWDLFCDEMQAMGVLTTADRWVLEQACFVYQDLLDARAIRQTDGQLVEGAKGGKVKNPINVDYHQSVGNWQRLMAEMGLTASARTRMSALPPLDKNDPVVGFLNRHKKETES